MIEVPPFASDDLPKGLEALMAGLSNAMASETVGGIAAQMPCFKSKAANCDPVRLATSFAALLTRPELQGNCLRLEALVHVSLAFGAGGRKSNDPLIASAFREIGRTAIGRAEDPPEDLFVNAVRCRRGNFRVLDGIWESSAFFLQHFLDVMATMPVDQEFQPIHRSVFALLALSDLLCLRCGLDRYQIGGAVDQNNLTSAHLADLSRRRAHLRFTPNDLSQLGINQADLAPFVLDLFDREHLAKETFGDSQIDRQPLIRSGNDLVFILPTAISTAVRYFVLDKMAVLGRLGTFLRNQAAAYEQWLSQLSILGGRIGAPVTFVPSSSGAMADVMMEIDTGRFLQLVLITDRLRDFGQSGLSGMNPDARKWGAAISDKMSAAHRVAIKQDTFVGGLTLVISCGVGRGAALGMDATPSDWRCEFISASDFETLCWTEDFKPTSLWKILGSRDALAGAGIQLLNVNGLLNLVAWTRELEGHLIPHTQIPREFAEPGVMATVMVKQNSLRDLRHDAAKNQDAHVERTPDGKWLRVRRHSLSVFKDDQVAPNYASEDPNDDGRPMSLYRARRRAWWADTKVDDAVSGHQAYERWRMTCVWLSRAAPVLDDLPGLPPGPVMWRAIFEGQPGEFDGHILDYEAARASIQVRVDRASNTVTTSASPMFNMAIFHPENIAERALVDALIDGFEVLAGAAPDSTRHADLLARIVPNTRARNSHAFYARTFRDEIQQNEHMDVVYVENDDEAPLRLGLGWRTRSRDDGDRIEGKRECTSYLNGLVKSATEDLLRDLKAFDRMAVIIAALDNHEAAARDRDNWQRTASAVLALHDDREDALQQFAEHEFKLNAVFQSARFVAEVANSACPIEGGRKPGNIDLARFMAKVGLVFQIGGWSDAIHWEAMEPTVAITPLGDVLANMDFVDEIIAPHARAGSDVRIGDAAGRYESHLERPTAATSTTEQLDPKFLEAWEEQVGAPFDDVRVLLDFIDNIGRDADALVVTVRRSVFDKVVVGDFSLSPQTVGDLLLRLSAIPTAGWDVLPEGMQARDRSLWRFRRSLSVLRRPILQIDQSDDPTYVIAPGLAREAVTYQLTSFYQGDFPTEQLTPKMKTWKFASDGRRGTAFSREVADAFKVAGWKAEAEVPVTKLLNRGFEIDFGDVDVLAWLPGTNRILVIECKDVQYRKTYGEVAEQLADFRGELRPNGKPDYLLRHLNRIDLIDQHVDRIRRYIGFEGDVYLESHLLFRNPVPMEFALQQMSKRVQVWNFSQFPSIWNRACASRVPEGNPGSAPGAMQPPRLSE